MRPSWSAHNAWHVLLQPSAHNAIRVGSAELVLTLCVLQIVYTDHGWLAVVLQGFSIPGDACSALPSTSDSKGSLLFVNNAAHSNLAGLVLRAVADGGPCTALSNFTTYLNWDFGIMTLKGITTDVTLRHVVVAGALACFIAQHPRIQTVSTNSAVRSGCGSCAMVQICALKRLGHQFLQAGCFP